MLGTRDQLAAVCSTMVPDCSFSIFLHLPKKSIMRGGVLSRTGPSSQSARLIVIAWCYLLTLLITVRYLLSDHSICMIWSVISSAGLDQSQLQFRRPSLLAITSLHISQSSLTGRLKTWPSEKFKSCQKWNVFIPFWMLLQRLSFIRMWWDA